MANRFDELIPLQIVPNESLYTPFRIKDNTDIYAQLLANKSKSTTKLDDIKPYKINDPLLSLDYNVSGQDNTQTQIHLPYYDLHSAVDGVALAGVQQMSTEILSAINRGENVDLGALATYAQAKSNYENNPYTTQLKKSQEALSAEFKKINTKNANTNAQNISEAIWASVALTNGFVPDAPILQQPSDKSYNELVKEFVTPIKENNFTIESARQLQEVLSYGSNIYRTYSTTTKTKGGSIFNEHLLELNNLSDITKLKHHTTFSDILIQLNNIGTNNKTSTDKFKYNTLGQLYVVITNGLEKSFGSLNLSTFSGGKLPNNEEAFEFAKKARETYLEVDKEFKEKIKNIDINEVIKDKKMLENIIPYFNKYGIKGGDNGYTFSHLDELIDKIEEDIKNKITQKSDKALDSKTVNYMKDLLSFKVNLSRGMLDFADEKLSQLLKDESYMNDQDGLKKDIKKIYITEHMIYNRKTKQMDEQLSTEIGLYTSKNISQTKDYSTISMFDNQREDKSGVGGKTENDKKFYLNSDQFILSNDSNNPTNTSTLYFYNVSGNQLTSTSSNINKPLFNFINPTNSSFQIVPDKQYNVYFYPSIKKSGNNFNPNVNGYLSEAGESGSSGNTKIYNKSNPKAIIDIPIDKNNSYFISLTDLINQTNPKTENIAKEVTEKINLSEDLSYAMNKAKSKKNPTFYDNVLINVNNKLEDGANYTVEDIMGNFVKELVKQKGLNSDINITVDNEKVVNIHFGKKQVGNQYFFTVECGIKDKQYEIANIQVDEKTMNSTFTPDSFIVEKNPLIFNYKTATKFFKELQSFEY